MFKKRQPYGDYDSLMTIKKKDLNMCEKFLYLR